MKIKKELDIIQSTLDVHNVKKTGLEETIDKKNKTISDTGNHYKRDTISV